jgi:hypothetical protein
MRSIGREKVLYSLLISSIFLNRRRGRGRSMRAKYGVSPAIAPARLRIFSFFIFYLFIFFIFAKNHKFNSIKNAAAYTVERPIFLYTFLKLKIRGL